MWNRLWSCAAWIACRAVLFTIFSCGLNAAETADARVPFRTVEGVLIVVQVRLNGSGPYAFLLDTGATSSAIDPKLSQALKLQQASTVLLSTVGNFREVDREEIDTFELGPIHAGPLRALVQPLSGLRALDPEIRGVLGQDVLRKVDYLIDNRRHFIEFDLDGRLARELSGERIAMEAVRTSRDETTRDVSLSVRIGENRPPLRMLLDSGATSVVFVPGLVQPSGGTQIWRRIANPDGMMEAASSVHVTLRIGNLQILTEGRSATKRLEQIAVDGLLPTGYFNRVYVGNTAGFVILEPGKWTSDEPRTGLFGHRSGGR